MKSLQESLLDDDLIDRTDKTIKDDIKEFLKANYRGASSCKISKTPNSDGKYEVSSTKSIEVKNQKITSLTNGTFIWTTVNGYFNCNRCYSLKSLEGAPKEVGEDFDCSMCDALTSLEGAPEKVGGNFTCAVSDGLISLKGAPKEVGEDFYCPYCHSLESLEGAPKEVGEYFDCQHCKVKFTEEDVKKVSNVRRKIFC